MIAQCGRREGPDWSGQPVHRLCGKL